MPTIYICRKCGRNHSKAEFARSRFCKTCDSFIIREYRENRSFKTSEKKTKNTIGLRRAAESLRKRIEDTHEYEVISEQKGRTKPDFRETVSKSWLWNAEYENALKLEKELIQQFDKKSLEEAIPGETASNEHGNFYSIDSECDSCFKKASYRKSRKMLISDLKIISGIGPVREQALKENGQYTIEDLKNHPIWQKPASEFLKLIANKDIGQVQNWLWKRLPKSHPVIHYLAGLCRDDDFAIIDIETLGLSERPIVLMGIAKPCKNRIRIHQFLLRDISDELGAICAFVSELGVGSSLVSYNGRSFDIPYVKQRLAYYGMDAPLSNPHFDLLHFTRRALRSKLHNCRLETVEKYLAIERGINIPSALVPQFYRTYLKTHNVGPLVAIVEHNKQDLITLATLFSRLYKEWKV
jgi:hypothetical protein